jgi:hypothetical protein
VDLIIDPTANSTTSVVCEHFKLNKDLATLADEIDSNNVKKDTAKRIRNVIGALRYKYSGAKLKKALYEFAMEVADDLENINKEDYDPLIEEYNKWLKDLTKFVNENMEFQTINDRKIGIIEIENAAPVYSITRDLEKHPEAPIDILIIMIHKYFKLGKDKNNKFKSKKYTKLEFRTHTDQEIIELAKLLGGGGHRFASGATIHDGMAKEEVLKTLETFLIVQPDNKD